MIGAGVVGGMLSLRKVDDDGQGLGIAPQRLTSTLTLPIDRGIIDNEEVWWRKTVPFEN